MTVGRKACSQNRSDNAFTCVTPLLVYKKHTLSDNHQICKQKHWGFNFPATMHLRELFSVRRIRRRGWTTATGRDITPCFPLPFLRCNALSAFSPPLCRQIPLVFCEPSFQGSDHLFWSPLPYFTQMHFFACAGPARSLREKCNLIFSVLDLLDWNILKPLPLDPYKIPNEQWLANLPNLKTFWSDLQIY